MLLAMGGYHITFPQSFLLPAWYSTEKHTGKSFIYVLFAPFMPAIIVQIKLIKSGDICIYVHLQFNLNAGPWDVTIIQDGTVFAYH